MLSDAGNIPGKPSGREQFLFTDLARFSDIADAAESIFLRCVTGQDLAGWHIVGKSFGCSSSPKKREMIFSTPIYPAHNI